MASQKVSLERKKELEQLDPFQENLIKTLKYAKENKKQLMIVGFSIVAIVIIFSSVLYSFRMAETNASTLASSAMNKYTQIKDPVEGYLAVENDFNSILEDYSNTAAGKIAKVNFAKICYNASKFDKAYDLYKEALKNFNKDPGTTNLLLSSLGHVCMALNKNDEAKKYFEKINKSDSPLLKDEANFLLGMLFETSGDRITSQKFYQTVATEYENSLYKPLAQSKLNVKE